VVEIKSALATQLKMLRLRRKLTQTQLAAVMESSQSRATKMEAGDATVSLELLVQALLAAGASRREIAPAFARSAK
jgi:transcriptional regulator with XRE-family HTH domain